MSKSPKTIYLQWHGDGEPDDGGTIDPMDVSWCSHHIFKHDVKYVREDVVASQQNRISQLEEALAFYAEFDQNTDEDGVYGTRPVLYGGRVFDHDQGEIARKALNTPIGGSDAV